MSLLASILYGQKPYPLPECLRLHTTATDDDDEIVPNTSGIAAYQCGSCRRLKKREEMYVKKDGNIGAQCTDCQVRQAAQRSRRNPNALR